jgi:hypothetical protein
MAGVAKLFDGHIISKTNTGIDFSSKKYKGMIIGLYFSAHWYVFCFCSMIENFSRLLSGVRHAVHLHHY